jgi:tRNA-specific 2-thiouridylase
MITDAVAFKESVVDYFVNEYKNGRTPNPCAVCNPRIKFGELLNKADELGARWLATGHYAVITRENASASDTKESGSNDTPNKSRFLLKRGKERGKDQSYFLARLSQEALGRTLFPIGTFPKEKIRLLAKKFGLAVSGKKESQEVCFIPDGEVAHFVENQLGRTFSKGPIIDGEGKTVGTHRGIIGYTIGQRKGLGIALGRPIYVTSIDAESNTLTIGDDRDLYHHKFMATHPHWISISEPSGPMTVQTRIRYKHKPASSVIRTVKGKVEVIFEQPQRAITPGQLAVFYDDDVVLGSAWIEKLIN